MLLLGIIMLGCQNITQQTQEVKYLDPLKVDRVEPPHWWIGFKNDTLQLMIKADNIQYSTVDSNTDGVEIIGVQKAESPNYLFVDLTIDKTTAPGLVKFVFSSREGKKSKLDYELRARPQLAQNYKGFNSEDVIYLITPDRFSNGNTDNDINQNLKEKQIDRSNDYARHGGDIQGITDHLDYIEDMGFTAIWSCPLRTNDMQRASYHGYAITDYYQVDPRFGTLQEYKTLVKEAQKRGIKFIMDQVVNHCGLNHWWMKDLPFKDWINYQDEFLAGQPTIYSNHRRTTNQDIYASDSDKKGMTHGWFVDAMPDLNQKNPFMAKYLIQNNIWWVEELGLGGIRQDTYPYADQEFLRQWAGAIMREYPNFSIVGEEWSFNPLLIGYWQHNPNQRQGYVSNLTSTMDFAMLDHIKQGVSQPESWDTGLVKIYEGLANDFHYPNPKAIMLMLDNHDMSRIFTELNGDIVQTKMALSTMLTLPRVPQLYYGTEILMQDFDKPGDHGLIRTDFPGGWTGDSVNAFTGEGLNSDQKEMQNFIKILLNFRKDSSSIHYGKTIHFAPKDGIYVLFRVLEEEVTMLILNKNDEPINLDLTRFEELNNSGKTFRDVITNRTFVWNETLNLPAKGSYIMISK